MVCVCKAKAERRPRERRVGQYLVPEKAQSCRSKFLYLCVQRAGRLQCGSGAVRTARDLDFNETSQLKGQIKSHRCSTGPVGFFSRLSATVQVGPRQLKGLHYFKSH
jgi:hypothetical protein